MTIEYILAGILLGITGVSDIKSKEISVNCLLLFVIPALLCTFYRFAQNETGVLTTMLMGLIPGILCLCLGRITKEKIGYGDAYLLLVLGMFLGLRETIGMIMIALFVTALISIVLLVLHKIKKTQSVPFVPALGIAFCLQIVCRYEVK
ncbi:MAG: prepilin peptidase [Lachnospiraceae bacterium]